jgi:hypothetical protein
MHVHNVKSSSHPKFIHTIFLNNVSSDTMCNSRPIIPISSMQELGAALSAGGGGQEAREVGVCQGCRELSTGRQGSGASGGRA